MKELTLNLGVTIFELDVFSLAQQILDDPMAFGFSNVSETARTDLPPSGLPPGVDTPGIGVVPNPDEYVFFDDIHPTRALHEIIGNEALALVAQPVPEPGTVILILTGILGIAGLRKMRK